MSNAIECSKLSDTEILNLLRINETKVDDLLKLMKIIVDSDKELDDLFK